MAKLSKQQMIEDLIELYSSDATVRDRMIPQIKNELQRINDQMQLGAIDWDFMRLSDAFYQRNPSAYFAMLMNYFFAMRDYNYVREQYNINFSKVSAH